MRFELTADGFKKDGQPFFLISGELHYFRVKKKDWAKHFEKMKQAHLNAVTSYIPWSWHEIEPGVFDMTGETKPERDIIGFIDLAGEMGLDVVVKPGPYILAEYQDQGIPKWLIEKHPEIQVYGADGKPNIPFVCAYMHPTYLDYAAKWFDQMIPVIRDRQFSKGGPVAMMQICNEVGLQQWLAGSGDYNPATLKFYYQFLEEKYRSIDALNALYRRSHKQFSEVIPPAGNMQAPEDLPRYRDWHEFHRWFYYVYIEYLIKDLRKRGIDLPFYENVPGWVYGRAHELPVCLTMYSEVSKRCPELLLGLDHIPENVDFRNFHDAPVISEMVQAMQGRKMPLFSAEFQAGSREHCVRTYPNELDLFYKSALGCGTQGWNYYMFSQGKNPPGEGVYGPTFYWDNPLDVKGKPTQAYAPVQTINRWIRGNEQRLVGAKRQAKVSVSFYKPYYETEFYYPLFLKDKYFRPEKAGIQFDVKTIRDIFYYEGLIKAHHILNCPPELSDLQVQSVEEMLKYDLLWVFCLDTMDAATQKKLLEFVQRGGKAVFYPVLPKMDLEGRSCEILKEGLGVRVKSVIYPIDSKVQFFNLEPVNTLPVIQELDAEGAEIISKIGRKVCGIEKKIGKGRATILGTICNYQIEEHLDVFKAFLTRDGIAAEVSSDEADVVSFIRKTAEGSFLFALNFHPVAKEAALDLNSNGKALRIPSSRRLQIPATSGLILPVNWSFPDFKAKLIYATSELFGHQADGSSLRLHLNGPSGTPGEVLIQMSQEPQKILFNGKEIFWTKTEEGVFVKYKHPSKEFILEVIL